jgi:hypothetical protein
MEVAVTPYYILRFTITLVCLTGIPTTYLSSVYRISKRLSARLALMAVIGLSIGSALVWWLVAAVLSVTFINCCFGPTKPFDHDFFNRTLAVPLNFCGTFHWVNTTLGTWACRVLDLVGLPCAFIIVGIVVNNIARRNVLKPPSSLAK